jgi:hypothetical protein
MNSMVQLSGDQPFSWGSFATDTITGGLTGGAFGLIGKGLGSLSSGGFGGYRFAIPGYGSTTFVGAAAGSASSGFAGGFGGVFGNTVFSTRWNENQMELFPGSKPPPTTSTIKANKSAGDAVRDRIAIREAPAKIEQELETVGGIRRLDVLKSGTERIAIESKVGLTDLSSHVRQELSRDWWLLRQEQVDRVIWEFSRSEVTGLQGPTSRLLSKLQKLGIEVRIAP